jgi:predicted RNA methylase
MNDVHLFLLMSRFVQGVDVDVDALSLCMENLAEYELEDSVDLINADIINTNPLRATVEPAMLATGPLRRKPLVDTVVMNPPFGTKLAGADMVFLKRGLEVRVGSG